MIIKGEWEIHVLLLDRMCSLTTINPKTCVHLCIQDDVPLIIKGEWEIDGRTMEALDDGAELWFANKQMEQGKTCRGSGWRVCRGLVWRVCRGLVWRVCRGLGWRV